MRLSVLLFCTFFPLLLFCQTFEGRVQYEITYKKVPMEMEAMKAAMPKFSELFIQGKKSRLVQNVEGIGDQIMIINEQSRTAYMVLDQFNTEVYAEVPSYMLNDILKPTIVGTTYKNETKTVLGKTCKRVDLEHPNDANPTVVWYTENLPVADYKDFKMLRGFVMEYELKDGGVHIVMSAKEVEEKLLDPSLFLPPSSFQKISWEDMVQTGFSLF